MLGGAPAVFSSRPGHCFIRTALLADTAAAQRTLVLSLIALSNWNASNQTGLGASSGMSLSGLHLIHTKGSIVCL